MDEKQMDSFLRQKAKMEQIELPEAINHKIDSTMKGLPKPRRLLKRGIAVAVAFILIGVGFSPTYAQNIPIIKSVFSYFSQTEDFYNKQYLKYSAAVDRSETDENFTVTINEVAVDDNYLVMSYTVEGNEDFSEEFASSPYLSGRASVNGKDLTGPAIKAEMIDKFSFAGYLSYFIGREQLPDNFTLDFQLNHICQTKSNLSFSFDISKTVAENDSEVAYPSVSADLPFGEVTVTKVAMSPLGNSIMLSVANPDPNPMIHKFFILDETGRSLYVTGNTSNGRNLHEVFFIKGENIPKDLTLIPYRFSPDYDLKPVEFLSEKLKNVPITFEPRNGTQLIVEKAVFTGSQAQVHYKIDGVYPYGYAVKLVLFDDQGSQIFPTQNTEQLIDPETNQFIVQFDGLDENKEYKISTPRLNDLEVLDKYKIVIPLEQ